MKNEAYSLKRIKVLGITRDFDTCECCGKTDLKKVVSILDLESEVVLHFGTSCAAKADKYDTLAAFNEAKKEISQSVRKFDDYVKSSHSLAFRVLKKKYGLERIAEYTYKPKCSEQEYKECQEAALTHILNAETRFKPFEWV